MIVVYVLAALGMFALGMMARARMRGRRPMTCTQYERFLTERYGISLSEAHRQLGEELRRGKKPMFRITD